MEKKQTKKRNNWKQAYNRLVKMSEECYLPCILFLIQDIFPMMNEQMFNYVCRNYSLKPEIILEFASKLGIKLNFTKEGKPESKTEDPQPEDIDPDYKVGYKHPPKHTRFQKGNKGNPKGRKSKKGRPIIELLLEELDKKIRINEGGETKEIYKREVITKDLSKSLILGVITKDLSKSLILGKPIPRNNLNLINHLDRYAARKEVVEKIFNDDNNC